MNSNDKSIERKNIRFERNQKNESYEDPGTGDIMKPIDDANEELGYNDEPLNRYFADLHIHIGSAMGKAVKITASRRLDLKTVIFEDAPRKGLDIMGIVDTGSTLVTAEIEKMISTGELIELDKGGFLARNGVLMAAGSEVESREGVHVIVYLPDLESIEKWQRYLRPRVHNLQLSTPKVDAGFRDILEKSLALDGIFCPAHAFTPHKGLYGMWTDKLSNKIGPDIKYVQTLEIGLSADADMADTLEETGSFTYLSNSDAHSSPNIGREFNLLHIKGLNFGELRLCLRNKEDRRILANYGLDPRLGKYHRTFCPACGKINENKPPVMTCTFCGNKKIVMGVYDRIVAIQDYSQVHHPPGRPPYYYRVPLKDLPGIGPRTYSNLLQAFDNEIELMEKTPLEEIMRAGGKKAAAAIFNLRSERLVITPGGGGKYGRVNINRDRHDNPYSIC